MNLLVDVNGKSTKALVRCHHLQNPPAEIGQIVRFAAANKVPIDDHGRIFPDGAAIDEIVFNAGRAGDAYAAVDASRDRHPATMTDGRDKLAGSVKVPREL